MHRRLPLYLLLDCSISMVGESWESLKSGLTVLSSELRSDPMALETVSLSIITFAGEARHVLPLTEVADIRMPELQMANGTSLGAGLTLLQSTVTREVRANTPSVRGDYRPLVFIITDGTPTDEWEKQADVIRGWHGPKATIVAVGCGPYADLESLYRLTDIVIWMKAGNSVSFREFFRWVSASVSSATVSTTDSVEKALQMDQLGGEFAKEIPELNSATGGTRTRFGRDDISLIPVRCSQTGQLVYYRFHRVQKTDTFENVETIITHQAEVEPPSYEWPIEFDIRSLKKIRPCPCCENPSIQLCNCAHLRCGRPASFLKPSKCPWCR